MHVHHQDIQEIVPGPSVHNQDIQEALPGSSVHQNIQETVPGPIVQRSPSVITIISTNPCCSRDNTTLTPRNLPKVPRYLQTAEIAMVTEHLTIGFDATTQEGVHINSTHFTTKTNCKVMSIEQIAGGTADDYMQHVCGSVDHLARVYSDFHGVHYDECRRTNGSFFCSYRG